VSTPAANILNIPAELGELLLQWSVAKYIEGAGSEPGAMTARAASVKAIATAIDGVALGTTTLAQLAAMGAADLEAKGISQSTQIAVAGLVAILPPVLPTTGLLAAANAAIVNSALQQVIAVCAKYGA
jgi:hypothetical protein